MADKIDIQKTAIQISADGENSGDPLVLDAMVREDQIQGGINPLNIKPGDIKPEVIKNYLNDAIVELGKYVEEKSPADLANGRMDLAKAYEAISEQGGDTADLEKIQQKTAGILIRPPVPDPDVTKSANTDNHPDQVVDNIKKNGGANTSANLDDATRYQAMLMRSREPTQDMVLQKTVVDDKRTPAGNINSPLPEKLQEISDAVEALKQYKIPAIDIAPAVPPPPLGSVINPPPVQKSLKNESFHKPTHGRGSNIL